MNKVKIQFLGSGDAFGSGGRLQTCIMVTSSQHKILLDCGTTVLIGMRKYKINPNDIEMIFISHLHGDHFGGLPYFILEAKKLSKRTAPLIIAGPAGIKQRVEQAMEILFPGSTPDQTDFDLKFIELKPDNLHVLEGVNVIPYLGEHPSGAPTLILRLLLDNKVLAFSGDTELTSNLIKAGQQADLFITEASSYEQKIKYHIDYKTLMKHKDEINAKRIIVTHMGEDMLSRLKQLDCEYAVDGKIFEV